MKAGLVIAAMMTGLLALGASAQKPKEASAPLYADTTEIRHFRIYYPVNKTELYEDYLSNAHNLEIIRTYLAESPRIDSIVIYSYASPEGPYRFNKWLAGERGATAKRYILSQVPEGRKLSDSLIHLRPEAENWPGLREEVYLNYHEADREEVLDILDSHLPDAEKKLKLQQLNGRKTWQHLIRHYMPKLRYATWISVWAPILPEIPQAPLTIDTTPATKEQPAPVDMPYEESRTILALKTNLLYDLLSWANFSVEVPFTVKGHQFSAQYQHQFPWWTWGEADNEYCNRFLSIGGEMRWWLRPQYHAATSRRKERDCLTGWFVGLYALSGKWDFERRRDICYQGEFWSTGLTAGYAMPIGRRLNLEFTLAVGYAGIPYRGYTPSADYETLYRDPENHGRWHYFGPTRAEVSLVLPIRLTRKGVIQKGGGR